MYYNLSHYIIIAIVRNDHRRELFGAGRRDVGAAMTGIEQRRASSLASPTHRRQSIFDKLDRAIPRAASLVLLLACSH